jgi:hypothetical protein
VKMTMAGIRVRNPEPILRADNCRSTHPRHRTADRRAKKKITVVAIVLVGVTAAVFGTPNRSRAEIPSDSDSIEQFANMDFQTLRNEIKVRSQGWNVSNREKADIIRRIVEERVSASNGPFATTRYIVSGMAKTVTGGPGGEWKAFYDETDRVAQGDSLNAAQLAQYTWEAHTGTCDPHANLMQLLLKDAGVDSTIWRSDRPNGHAFVVVDLPKGADPDNPWTWGNAFVPDSWQRDTISGAQEIWKNGQMFGGGDYHVYNVAKDYSARQWADFFAADPSRIDQHPVEFQRMMSRLEDYPPEIRDQITRNLPDNTPPVDSDASFGQLLGALDIYPYQVTDPQLTPYGGGSIDLPGWPHMTASDHGDVDALVSPDEKKQMEDMENSILGSSTDVGGKPPTKPSGTTSGATGDTTKTFMNCADPSGSSAIETKLATFDGECAKFAQLCQAALSSGGSNGSQSDQAKQLRLRLLDEKSSLIAEVTDFSNAYTFCPDQQVMQNLLLGWTGRISQSASVIDVDSNCGSNAPAGQGQNVANLMNSAQDPNSNLNAGTSIADSGLPVDQNGQTNDSTHFASPDRQNAQQPNVPVNQTAQTYPGDANQVAQPDAQAAQQQEPSAADWLTAIGAGLTGFANGVQMQNNAMAPAQQTYYPAPGYAPSGSNVVRGERRYATPQPATNGQQGNSNGPDQGAQAYCPAGYTMQVAPSGLHQCCYGQSCFTF